MWGHHYSGQNEGSLLAFGRGAGNPKIPSYNTRGGARLPQVEQVTLDFGFALCSFIFERKLARVCKSGRGREGRERGRERVRAEELKRDLR